MIIAFQWQERKNVFEDVMEETEKDQNVIASTLNHWPLGNLN